jgi:hypothetical protein
MKRFAIIAVLMLLVSGCDRRGPSVFAYKRPVDLLRLALGRLDEVCSDPGKSIQIGPGAPVKTRQAISVDQCYRFGPSVRMHGVWYDEFEYDRYFAQADSLPNNHRYSFDDTLLNIKYSMRPYGIEGNCHRSFVIDFLGRRTLAPGPYGDSRDIVVVDKVIAMRELPPAPGFLLKHSPREDPRYGGPSPNCVNVRRQN